IDPNSSRIQFAVLKLSGDLADNGKYAPVPFSLLKRSDMSAKTDLFGHHDLILQTDRDKLLSASKFNLKSWPDRDNTVVWGPEVYSHYGVTMDSNVARGGTGVAVDTTTGSDTQVRIRDRELRYRDRSDYPDYPYGLR